MQKNTLEICSEYLVLLFLHVSFFSVLQVVHQQTQNETIEDLAHLNHHLRYNNGHNHEGLIKVQRLAGELGVSDRVHFMYVRSDVPRILKTSDVVMMSSEYEGLSLSSIEGMAAGKPFVATDVNGLREMVAGTGELFELYNADQLAAILSKLESDKNYYNLVSNRCCQRASEFDIKIMVDNYMAIYNKVR